MAGVKISSLPAKPPEAGDSLPLAVPGEAAARRITLALAAASLPAASESAAGTVELAESAETGAASAAGLAVTPASLAAGVGRRAWGGGFCCLYLSVAPPTQAALDAAFLAAFGRQRARGDLAVARDNDDALHLLAWNSSRRKWQGMNLSTGAHESL